MLNGSVIVVTGGTGGIGRACAEALLASGAKAVVVNGRNPKRAQRAQSELKARFPTAHIATALGDVSHPDVAAAVMNSPDAYSIH